MPTTKIDVQACDNEIIILASTPAGSSVLCHLKSGYNAPVSYIFNPTHILPPGKYDLTVIGINWGGPANFKVAVTAVPTIPVIAGSGGPAPGVAYFKTVPITI